MSRIAIGNDGVLTMDGRILPCIVSSIGGRGKIVMDSSKVQGSSGKKKVFSGFEDWDLSIDATIYESDERQTTRYDHLRTVNDVFKKLENGVSVIYSLESRLAAALNIRRVLFASLDVTDASDRDAIDLSINFTEHDPVVALVQDQQAEGRDNTGGRQEVNNETVSETAYTEDDTVKMWKTAEIYG